MEKTYKIQVSPISSQKYCALKPYIIEVKTSNLESYMEQYQRNRGAFHWKIVK